MSGVHILMDSLIKGYFLQCSFRVDTEDLNPIGWRSRRNEEIFLLLTHLARLFSCEKFLWRLYGKRACSHALGDKTGLLESGLPVDRHLRSQKIHAHNVGVRSLVQRRPNLSHLWQRRDH